MAKIVYGWVVNWNKPTSGKSNTIDPRITCDLFFSSKEKFAELLGWGDEATQEELLCLVPVKVRDSFDDLDYIPDNY